MAQFGWWPALQDGRLQFRFPMESLECLVGIIHPKEEVLLRVKEQRNILHEISKRKANWIGHILRRNCLLQRVIEGKIKGGMEVTERRRRRLRKLLDDLKERRDCFHLKEEALGSTVHSFSSLSYDRSKASSKASSPHSAIQSFLFQMRVSSPFLKVIQ